jgi:hypothetical protein
MFDAHLREDAADAWIAAVRRVKERGGRIGFDARDAAKFKHGEGPYVDAPRALRRTEKQGTSKRSFHYTAQAVDLAQFRDGGPHGEYFIVEEPNEKGRLYWRIYCRVESTAPEALHFNKGDKTCVHFYFFTKTYAPAREASDRLRALDKTLKAKEAALAAADDEAAQSLAEEVAELKDAVDTATTVKAKMLRKCTEAEQAAQSDDKAPDDHKPYFPIPAGYYVDLTATIEADGTFQRIPAHAEWKMVEKDREWWHFQFTGDLNCPTRPTFLDECELIGRTERKLKAAGWSMQDMDGYVG